jgi:hypothetical protein
MDAEFCLALGAFIAAIAAWWISWREACRNNKVMIRLRRFDASFNHSIIDGKAVELRIVVTNLGVQVQNLSMGIGFHGQNMCGCWQCPIPLAKRSNNAGAIFLRGATAEFVMSSRDFENVQFMSHLTALSSQRPVIQLFSDSYLVWTIPICSRFDWMKTIWNRLAYRMSLKRRVGPGANGAGVFKTYSLPMFLIRSEKMNVFLSMLAEHGNVVTAK